MEIDYISHHLLFFASLAMGLFSGAVYDLFRFTRCFLKGRVFLFFSDIVFCVYYSCFMCVLFFNYSHGRIRAYALMASAFGFAAYYFTFGKVTKSVFNTVKASLVRFAGFIKPRIQRTYGSCYRKAYSFIAMRSLVSKASKGFKAK